MLYVAVLSKNTQTNTTAPLIKISNMINLVRIQIAENIVEELGDNNSIISQKVCKRI